ncbi:putative phage abortive infection protein [Bacillus sp. V2I10]|uniref:putative phage abortive infection protein n=1 Tax=Bacillus sp. V2I10 TaxID=3042276 RepID=UPI00277F6870|nr:putative phage abortive infection protein [Bacillus sp. V2I10]MDQ0862136.1 hypothetical protein [Bacillus sp. V2I10]
MRNKVSYLKSKLTELSIWSLTFLGIILIITATVMPFKVREYYKPRIEEYKNLADIGAVGDFIGGTTVAFLTAASVVLLLATIIMQRKEIKISQQSILELVKQTEASVKQADESRKETQITNETMKRQQFETTFFNMITLHQNVVDKLSLKDTQGNKVIKKCLEAFSDYYFENANSEFKKMYLTDDFDEIVDLIGYLQRQSVSGMESVQLNSKKEVLKVFEELDFRDVLNLQNEKRMIKDFFNYAYNKPQEDLIRLAYYQFDLNYDSILGGYFNSISTILKFLHESQFESEDRQNNTQNNKIYREVLFSQFSPHELMMIYYYAKYLPFNDWLLIELKTYNLFYPRLGETLYLFWSVDKKHIEELSI